MRLLKLKYVYGLSSINRLLNYASIMLVYWIPFFKNKKLQMGSDFDFLQSLPNKSFLCPGSMFTSSQTITAEKLTSLNRGWRHVDSLKEENGEKAAFIKLRYVVNGSHN